MKITIAGGGIGGLTCAIALRQAGFENIDVFESVDEIKELGVGVNLLPHAVRELDELGMLDALYNTAIPTAELSYLTTRGQLVWKEPRGLDAGYRWPQFSIHRGHLLGVIYRAAVAALGADRIHIGHHLSRFGTEGSSAWAEFVNRASGETITRTESDLLIACDGVHSTVRTALYPDEGPPKWNGTTMWRGTTVREPFQTGRSMFIAGRFVHRVVIYPISKTHADQGKSLVNWVCEKKQSDNQPMPKQDWQHEVDRQEVYELFREFKFPELGVDVGELITNAEEILQYPMVDRDALPTWNHGRVTLLGDAAHPMYPVGSNGASQAIIDARTLAYHLATADSIEAALASYDTIRRPITAGVVEANRKVGPEKCIEIAEQRAPNGFTDIHDVISQQELEDIAIAYKRTAGFDPDILNNRESLSVK